MGGTVRRQADYKTGVLSTSITRGPRRPKFLERSEPTQVLLIRRRAGIAISERLDFFLSSQFGGYVR
jgi:hypothetical protein